MKEILEEIGFIYEDGKYKMYQDLDTKLITYFEKFDFTLFENIYTCSIISEATSKPKIYHIICLDNIITNENYENIIHFLSTVFPNSKSIIINKEIKNILNNNLFI